MRPFPKPILAELHELLHDGQNRITDLFGRFLQFRHVDLVGRAMAHDFGSGFLRNDAKPGLRARKRGLEIKIFLHPTFIREDIPHRFCREDVAEYSGIEDR